MNWKKILQLVLLIAGVLWYRQAISSDQNAIPVPPADSDITGTSQEIRSESIAAQYTFAANRDSQTAQELLDESAEVEYEDFGEAGLFVTSIDGLAADDGHYWAFYLNGEYAQAGVSQTILKEGDIITFTYETIDPTQL